MTYAFPGRRRGLRTSTAVGAVSLGLLALTACEKPTPLAMVTVGDDTYHAEGTCYPESGTLSDKKFRACLKKKGEETITVTHGEKVRVGVEPAIADSGWFVTANGSLEAKDPINTTYQSFDADEWFASQMDPRTGTRVPGPDEVRLSVIEVKDNGFRGVWNFTLKRD